MPDIHVTFKRNSTTIRDEVVNAEEVPENDRSVTTDQGVVVPVATIVYEAYGSEGRIYGGMTTLYSAEGDVLNIQTMTAAPPPPEAERKDSEPDWSPGGTVQKFSGRKTICQTLAQFKSHPRKQRYTRLDHRYPHTGPSGHTCFSLFLHHSARSPQPLITVLEDRNIIYGVQLSRRRQTPGRGCRTSRTQAAPRPPVALDTGCRRLRRRRLWRRDRLSASGSVCLSGLFLFYAVRYAYSRF